MFGDMTYSRLNVSMNVFPNYIEERIMPRKYKYLAPFVTGRYLLVAQSQYKCM